LLLQFLASILLLVAVQVAAKPMGAVAVAVDLERQQDLY
jgi:hypothetical protein